MIDPYLAAVNSFNILFGDDLSRGSDLIDLPCLEEDEPVTEFRGEVHVMRGHDNGQSLLPVEIEDALQEIDLVMDVQGGRGFVEKDDLRLLGQGPGDENPLSLSAGEFIDGPFRERKGVGPFHGPSCDLQVPLAFEHEMAQIGRPSHQDDLHDTEREEGMGLLRDDRNLFCDLCPVHLPEREPLRKRPLPAEGSEGGKRILRREVFPEPLGPMIPINSPFSIRKETSWRTQSDDSGKKIERASIITS